MKLEDFKNGISDIKPDPYMETRITQNVYEAAPKKRSKRKFAVAMASGMLSLAVLITGLGIGAASQNRKSVDEFGTLVAYASMVDNLKAGSKNKQNLFYSIHFAPKDDKAAAEEAYEKYQADCNELYKLMDELGKEGYSANLGHGEDGGSNDAGEYTADIYKVGAGHFAVNLYDYTNVETFKVENSGKYGVLEFSYDYYGRIEDTGNEFAPLAFYGHEFEISGDTLRRSQESEFYECGKGKHTLNLGYTLEWEISSELKRAIGNDLNVDLSDIKDTITFTVAFTDGTVKTASIDLYFDSDGYMHIGEN